MAIWTPPAGLVVGAGLLAVYSLSTWLFPLSLAAALVLSAWIGISGGLHLDGLGDCCDAFQASVSTTRRLEIMQDPHLGTFGVTGIVLAILIKYCAIVNLPPESWISFLQTKASFPFALLFAPVAGRWLILWTGRGESAHSEGMGMEFAQGINLRKIAIAGVLPLIMIGINGITALVALLVAAAGVWLFTKIAQKKIGGVSGDVLGACIEVGEVLVLLVYALKSSGG